VPRSTFAGVRAIVEELELRHLDEFRGWGMAGVGLTASPSYIASQICSYSKHISNIEADLL
jgi:hypothetical protein